MTLYFIQFAFVKIWNHVKSIVLNFLKRKKYPIAWPLSYSKTLSGDWINHYKLNLCVSKLHVLKHFFPWKLDLPDLKWLKCNSTFLLPQECTDLWKFCLFPCSSSIPAHSGFCSTLASYKIGIFKSYMLKPLTSSEEEVDRICYLGLLHMKSCKSKSMFWWK